MHKNLCIRNNCCIFAIEKETKNKLNHKTRKGTNKMKAYITIDTKNGKNGAFHFINVLSVEEAKAWANGNQSYIDGWKKKRNFEKATLTVFNGKERKYFSFL